MIHDLFLERNSIGDVRIIDDNFKYFKKHDLSTEFGICEKIAY